MRFENNPVPERFEAFDQAMGRSNLVASVKVVRAELLISGGPFQHVVAAVRIELATAISARLGPRSAAKRRNCACR